MKRGSERPCAARGAQFVRGRKNQSWTRLGGALPAGGEPGRPGRARKSQSSSRCRVPSTARRPGPGEAWGPVGERTPTPAGERARSWPKPHASSDRESKERTPGAPPGAPEDAAMGQGRRGPPEERTLPLFAALPPPEHAKTRLPREPGRTLCRYLRHLRLLGQANRRSRSSGRQIRPESRGNGTGGCAISGAKPRVFGGFRGGEAIWPESPVSCHRTPRVFRPELAAPERN